MANIASIKDRVEKTIANLLGEDPTLGLLIPREENAHDKPKKPFIAVKAAPSSAIAGTNIFRTPVAIELQFDAKKPNQDGPALDLCADLVYEKLKAARDAGTYGVTLDGETQIFDGDTGRTRTINATIVAI